MRPGMEEVRKGKPAQPKNAPLHEAAPRQPGAIRTRAADDAKHGCPRRKRFDGIIVADQGCGRTTNFSGCNLLAAQIRAPEFELNPVGAGHFDDDAGRRRFQAQRLAVERILEHL